MLQTGVAVAVGGAMTGAANFTSLAVADGGPDLPRGAIDAHVHVWTPDVAKYPLAAGYKVEDMKPRSFTPEELLAQARPVGVGRIVLIQMSFYGFDNSYMLETIQRYPGVFSGVAVINPHAYPAATMRNLKKQGVRGFRIRPNAEKKETPEAWLGTGEMRIMWECAAKERLNMCGLVNPWDLAELDKMCEKHPDTPVVVDHFARIGADGTVRDEDVKALCRLARHKHTSVKVSAFYALGQKKSPYTDLASMVKRLLEAYGPERLMWATDCPYQVQEGHNYADSIELVRSRLDFLSSADKTWLLARTAERVFFGPVS